LFQAEKQMINR